MTIFLHIKSKISILEIVGGYTTLKKMGGYWTGICPFHEERTPSFSVTPGREIFYCFGCHKSGDVISFIANIEGCSQFEAALLLADQYSILLPADLLKYDKQIVDENQEKRKRYWKLFNLVAEWLHEQFNRSGKAQKYCKDRSLTPETLSLFNVGYFPAGREAIQEFIKMIQAHHFLIRDILEANLFFESGSGLYSPFQERILFPIKDHTGRVVALGGRIFLPSDERAKYYNLKETSYFHKGSTLFNLDFAKKTIQTTGLVYMVEGYLDCVALVQQGYYNAVATMGTACTVEHLTLLSRYAHTIYVLYDGDSAGQQAILKLTTLCWHVELDVRVVSLPHQHDPASLVESGISLAPYIEQAQDIFVFFIESLGTGFRNKNLQQKMEAAHKLIAMIAAVKEPLKRDFLLRKGAETLAVPQAILESYLAPTALVTSEKIESTSSLAPNSIAKIDRSSAIEKKLFSVIINSMYRLPQDDAALLGCFQPPLRAILSKMQEYLAKQPMPTFMDFYQDLGEEERHIVNELTSTFQSYTDFKEIDQLSRKLQGMRWKESVESIGQQILGAQKAGDATKVEQLLEEFQQIKTKAHSFIKS